MSNLRLISTFGGAPVRLVVDECFDLDGDLGVTIVSDEQGVAYAWIDRAGAKKLRRHLKEALKVQK